MRANRICPARRTEPGHCLYLLLFFACGALLLRFSPELARPFLRMEGVTPLLLLLPGLLSGCLLGSYLIPLASLLLGILTMHRVSALGLPAEESLLAWLRELSPLLLLVPVFFLLAQGGMEQADACLACYAQGGAKHRRLLLRRQLLVFAAIAAAGLVRRMIPD